MEFGQSLAYDLKGRVSLERVVFIYSESKVLVSVGSISPETER